MDTQWAARARAREGWNVLINHANRQLHPCIETRFRVQSRWNSANYVTSITIHSVDQSREFFSAACGWPFLTLMQRCPCVQLNASPIRHLSKTLMPAGSVYPCSHIWGVNILQLKYFVFTYTSNGCLNPSKVEWCGILSWGRITSFRTYPRGLNATWWLCTTMYVAPACLTTALHCKGKT